MKDKNKGGYKNHIKKKLLILYDFSLGIIKSIYRKYIDKHYTYLMEGNSFFCLTFRRFRRYILNLLWFWRLYLVIFILLVVRVLWSPHYYYLIFLIFLSCVLLLFVFSFLVELYFTFKYKPLQQTFVNSYRVNHSKEDEDGVKAAQDITQNTYLKISFQDILDRMDYLVDFYAKDKFILSMNDYNLSSEEFAKVIEAYDQATIEKESEKQHLKKFFTDFFTFYFKLHNLKLQDLGELKIVRVGENWNILVSNFILFRLRYALESFSVFFRHEKFLNAYDSQNLEFTSLTLWAAFGDLSPLPKPQDDSNFLENNSFQYYLYYWPKVQERVSKVDELVSLHNYQNSSWTNSQQQFFDVSMELFNIWKQRLLSKNYTKYYFFDNIKDGFFIELSKEQYLAWLKYYIFNSIGSFNDRWYWLCLEKGYPSIHDKNIFYHFYQVFDEYQVGTEEQNFFNCIENYEDILFKAIDNCTVKFVLKWYFKNLDFKNFLLEQGLDLQEQLPKQQQYELVNNFLIQHGLDFFSLSLAIKFDEFDNKGDLWQNRINMVLKDKI